MSEERTGLEIDMDDTMKHVHRLLNGMGDLDIDQATVVAGLVYLILHRISTCTTPADALCNTLAEVLDQTVDIRNVTSTH